MFRMDSRETLEQKRNVVDMTPIKDLLTSRRPGFLHNVEDRAIREIAQAFERLGKRQIEYELTDINLDLGRTAPVYSGKERYYLADEKPPQNLLTVRVCIFNHML